MTEIVPLAMQQPDQPEEGSPVLQMTMNGKPINSDATPDTPGAVVSPDPRGGASAYQIVIGIDPADRYTGETSRD